jgi:hypothetical protein
MKKLIFQEVKSKNFVLAEKDMEEKIRRMGREN